MEASRRSVQIVCRWPGIRRIISIYLTLSVFGFGASSQSLDQNGAANP